MESPLPVVRIAWKNRVLDFSRRIYVMGILNATPDSFYAPSRVPEPETAAAAAEAMAAAGADMVDVGGESTRPGSTSVSEEAELERVLPVIRAVRGRSDIIISIDTRRRAVAQQALAAGADLVNIVGGLLGDDEFASFIARADVPVVLMHMRGTPLTMQENPRYDDPVREVTAALRSLVEHARGRGVRPDRIILDPGIGFGKRAEDNLGLLKHLEALKREGYPVLVGLSRKSFLGAVTGRPAAERLAGTVAAHMLSVLGGADILRVHDVREAVDVARLGEALRHTP
jgi:dihydropteroate synthase